MIQGVFYLGSWEHLTDPEMTCHKYSPRGDLHKRLPEGWRGHTGMYIRYDI